jgi:hypothetical protein
MHFGTKRYLKSTRNHTAKHALYRLLIVYAVINEIRGLTIPIQTHTHTHHLHSLRTKKQLGSLPEN